MTSLVARKNGGARTNLPYNILPWEFHRNLVIFGRILIEKMSTIKIEIKRHWGFSFE